MSANSIKSEIYRMQKQSQGYIVPDSFTHGTSAQRMKSFMLGFNSGDISLGEI